MCTAIYSVQTIILDSIQTQQTQIAQKHDPSRKRPQLLKSTALSVIAGLNELHHSCALMSTAAIHFCLSLDCAKPNNPKDPR